MASSVPEYDSNVYSKYRPQPPPKLIETIIEFLAKYSKANHAGKWKTAVDVGCGPGICTQLLHPYFETIYGFDISQNQIEEAIRCQKYSNIIYKVSPAESLPLPNGSADLMICATAIHYFDLVKFYTEVDRVLANNGVLAVFSYFLPTLHSIDGKAADEKKLENLVSEVYHGPELTSSFKERIIGMVGNQYRNLTLPYPDFTRVSDIVLELEWTCEELVGLIKSWSGYHSLQKEKPSVAEALLQQFKVDFAKAIGPEAGTATKVKVKYPYSLLLTRKRM